MFTLIPSEPWFEATEHMNNMDIPLAIISQTKDVHGILSVSHIIVKKHLTYVVANPNESNNADEVLLTLPSSEG